MQSITGSVITPRGDIRIREANPGDAIPFRELRLEALQDSPTSFSADYQMALHRPNKYWEDTLQMDEDESTILLAEQENLLLGMTGIARGHSPKTRHGAEIWGVYVRPAWRRLRIAESLIEACLGWATARNIERVKLGVAVTNEPAVRCYHRCGFSTVGTEPRAMLYNGKYYDFLLMSRSLNDR